MLTSQLYIGDRIEANVKGVSFTATIVGRSPDGLFLKIEPDDPKRYTWRFLTARKVVKKLEAQGRLGVAS